jgi:hypothetical protein
MIPEAVVVAPPMLLDLDNVRFAHADAGWRLHYSSPLVGPETTAAAKNKTSEPGRDETRGATSEAPK